MSDAPGFETERLADYLRGALPNLSGSIQLQRIEGGQSNPTFFVTVGDRRLVLRKQPPGELLPSAHAIDREYRVQAALAGSGVPVPRMLHYCSDPSVIGTPFYLMDRLDGRVFHECSLPGVAPADRGRMYDSLAASLAALHNVDPEAVGLDDYGRHGGYFARQIARWTRQWELTRQGDNPDVTRLIAWLPEHIPEDEAWAISHGDFRVGNVMFAADAPRVVGVLDWELSTLGHPLADLAHCCIAWHSRADQYGGVDGLDLRAAGIPTQASFEGAYYARANHRQRLEPFHMAFVLFRFAVVFEGIAARAAGGNAAAANAGEVARIGRVFAERAVALI
jgi:aminoglycoside phosphotransferase (APT) family kinase protein